MAPSLATPVPVMASRVLANTCRRCRHVEPGDVMAAKNKPMEALARDLENSWHEFPEGVSQAHQEVVITR